MYPVNCHIFRLTSLRWLQFFTSWAMRFYRLIPNQRWIGKYMIWIQDGYDIDNPVNHNITGKSLLPAIEFWPGIPAMERPQKGKITPRPLWVAGVGFRGSVGVFLEMFISFLLTKSERKLPKTNCTCQGPKRKLHFPMIFRGKVAVIFSFQCHVSLLLKSLVFCVFSTLAWGRWSNL